MGTDIQVRRGKPYKMAVKPGNWELAPICGVLWPAKKWGFTRIFITPTFVEL